MAEVSYKNPQSGELSVEIDGKNLKDQIAYATFGQFLLDGKGQARPDLQNIIPQFQDLRHVYSFAQIKVADLPLLPAGQLVSKPEVYFGVPQLSANGYALAKEAWNQPVVLNLNIPLTFRTETGIETKNVNVPLNVFQQALLQSGYQEVPQGQVHERGQFAFEEGRVAIFFKPGVYPRTIVGVTAEGKLKVIGISGKSGQSGTTLDESSRLASEKGLVQAMLLEHGGNAKIFANGEYVLPSSEDRYHRTSALLITTKQQRRSEVRKQERTLPVAAPAKLQNTQ